MPSLLPHYYIQGTSTIPLMGVLLSFQVCRLQASTGKDTTYLASDSRQRGALVVFLSLLRQGSSFPKIQCILPMSLTTQDLHWFHLAYPMDLLALQVRL